MAVVTFTCNIDNVLPICGTRNSGTFLCGGSSGPFSILYPAMTRNRGLGAGVQGQALVQAQEAVTRAFAAPIQGEAFVGATRYIVAFFAVAIQGQGVVVSPFYPSWPPTDAQERDWFPSDDDDVVPDAAVPDFAVPIPTVPDSGLVWVPTQEVFV